jgi:hypothetical protein
LKSPFPHKWGIWGFRGKRRYSKYPVSPISPLFACRGIGAEVFPELQSFFSPALKSMIDKNKALLILINGLELEEL